MSKKLTFTVTLEFADKIQDDNEIMEIAQNLANAVQNETNGMGIAPESSETYTVGVEVKPQFLDETVSLKIV